MSPRFALAVALPALLFAASIADAGERHFAFTFEVPVHQPGELEYEQYITWNTDKDTDPDFDEIKFRHELEFGVAENLQLGVYLSDWRYRDGRSVADDGAEWTNVAGEAIYQFTDPTADPLGVSAYFEVKLGDEKFVLEPKLLLQKNIGQWIFAYNFVFEAEWEGADLSELHDEKAVFKNLAGIAYQISPNWSVGGELVHELEYTDWSQWADSTVHLGPNVSFRKSNWFVTVTPLFQATDEPGAANFETRIIFGIDF